MEVSAAILGQFTLETVQYDGWIELTHHSGRCDWAEDVSCYSLLAIVQQAIAHGDDCDGTPQPRTPVVPLPPSLTGDVIPKLWWKEIEEQALRALHCN